MYTAHTIHISWNITFAYLLLIQELDTGILPTSFHELEEYTFYHRICRSYCHHGVYHLTQIPAHDLSSYVLLGTTRMSGLCCG